MYGLVSEGCDKSALKGDLHSGECDAGAFE